MKNDKEKMCGSQPCASGCWCGKCLWWKLLKLFLCLAVALFVFVCGVGVGVKISYFKTGKLLGYDGLGMMRYYGTGYGQGNMMKLLGAEDSAYGFKAQSHAVRLFGNITKIDGNKITILDNSAKEQVLVSQPDTVIVDADMEIGISNLEAGLNIVAVGALDKDNQLLAKTIQVQ